LDTLDGVEISVETNHHSEADLTYTVIVHHHHFTYECSVQLAD